MTIVFGKPKTEKPISEIQRRKTFQELKKKLFLIITIQLVVILLLIEL